MPLYSVTYSKIPFVSRPGLNDFYRTRDSDLSVPLLVDREIHPMVGNESFSYRETENP